MKRSVFLPLAVLCSAGALGWYLAFPARTPLQTEPGSSLHSVRVASAAIKLPDEQKAAKLYEVAKVENFELTGSGGSATWQKARWADMKREEKGGHTYFSRFKMVYSSTGCLLYTSDAADE